MQLHAEPEPRFLRDTLASELRGFPDKRGNFVQLVAECEVRYRGRAQSTLLAGERVILIKPDGTLLIHGPTKAKPVNWQPPGASFDAALDGDVVVLTALRRKPEEWVEVRVLRALALMVLPLDDREALELVGSESDLQALLYDRPDLVEPGFVPRRRERDSDRGYYDLDGDDVQGHRLIVEVKRGVAGVEDAQQLWRYVEPHRQGRPLRGMLIAARVAPKARQLLQDHDLEWQELDWQALLPQVHEMQRAGQASLAGFAVPGDKA